MEPNLFESLLNRFYQQDRSALAQAITIVESTALRDKADARLLLSKLSKTSDTIRVAISGPPGVGKSTLINALGQKIIQEGFFLAVLPVDPSSEYSQGSILGDKTRMKELLALDKAYIRPAPSKGVLGGVSLHTPDTIALVEAFGCNFLLIETVGVGQSEALAHNLADHFVLMLQPGLGDSVQMMKKGVLESADFILINKGDEHKELALKAQNSLKGFKNFFYDEPPVFIVSALEDQGIDGFLTVLLARHREQKASGKLLAQRKAQKEKLFFYCFEQELNRRLKVAPKLKTIFQESLKRAEAGLMPEIDELVLGILQKL